MKIKELKEDILPAFQKEFRQDDEYIKFSQFRCSKCNKRLDEANSVRLKDLFELQFVCVNCCFPTWDYLYLALFD